MPKKKEYHGAFLLFSLVLSVLLLINCSTSFATEANYYDYNIPIEWFDACINYYNSLALPIDFCCSSGELYDYYNNVVSGELINLWSGEGLNELNMIVQFSYQTWSNGSKQSQLIFIQNNNTIGNIADNNCQLILNNSSAIKVKAIVPTWQINVSLTNNGVVPSFSTSTKTSSGQTSTKTYNDLLFGSSNIDNNTTTLIGMPLFGVNAKPLNVVNCTINNVANYWYFINNYYDINTQPQEDMPSGDSGDLGGLGNITNPSGDNNGNINLQPIQNSLNNINDSINNGVGNIINNQNNNTNRIVDTLSGENQKLINSITNTEIDVDPSGEFEDMLSSTNINDPTANFVSWLLDNIEQVFSFEGDTTLEFDIFEKHIVIRSDFFVLPDGDFKTFLRYAFLGWFGYIIIMKIRYIVYAIKCVKIQDALHEVTFNPNLL